MSFARSIPTVVREEGSNKIAMDLYSQLAKDRIILLSGVVDFVLADLVCAQLLFHQSTDPKRPIQMYINSPGGYVTAGLAIYDLMQHVTCPVETIVMGHAVSMAAILLVSGAKGRRAAMPNAEIMIHQVSGGFSGQATDAEIHMTQMLKTKRQLTQIVANHSGRSYDEILAACERDRFLTAEEAKAYGLIDLVVGTAVTPKAEVGTSAESSIGGRARRTRGSRGVSQASKGEAKRTQRRRGVE